MTESSMLDPYQIGLRSDDVEAMHGVFKRHPDIREVLLYGSRAMGTYREGSDIDLTLKGCLDHVNITKAKPRHTGLVWLNITNRQ